MQDSQPPASAPSDSASRWSEIELLPAWGEEFYDVYTARKFGKWVMLKTLKPQFRDDPRYRDMIEKEFDVRYNLAHPNIVMINDYEDVPGIGRCIITDDVYGSSLRTLLDKGELSDKHYEQLCSRLPMAMEYIQQNHLAHHPIRPETIIFTENIGNLKLIDVGFEQHSRLSHSETNNDIQSFGDIMTEVLDRTGRHDPRMRFIARKARNGGFRDVISLQMAIAGNSSRWFIIIAVFLFTALVIVLVWLMTHTLARP